MLKSVEMLVDILGKGGRRNLGFDIPRGKVTARQAVMLNKAAKELPSESDITKADFKLEGGELYYIGSRKPLTTEGRLKSAGMLADILGKN